MKQIENLIPDIQKVLKDGYHLKSTFDRKKEVHKPSLRLSQMGPQCPRALWYSIHHPELVEEMQPWTEFKFMFGHVIEMLAIELAKAAGHEVTGEQDELELDGVLGHRDCIIDGCTVDVKSAASKSFLKFKNKTLHLDDMFGYLDQLDGYVVASANDPLVRVKDKGYLLAIDKQLGHMCLYPHEVTHERSQTLRRRISTYRDIVAQGQPPSCTCGTQSDGSSGNIKLDVKASYSNFKHCCFPQLRTFLYANGPVYLTNVARLPYDIRTKQYIREIDRHGQTVYH